MLRGSCAAPRNPYPIGLSCGFQVVEHDWVKITVNGISDVKAALGRLPRGARVVWWGERDLPRGYPVPAETLELPPVQLVDELRSWCTELGIQMKVSP